MEVHTSDSAPTPPPTFETACRQAAPPPPLLHTHLQLHAIRQAVCDTHSRLVHQLHTQRCSTLCAQVVVNQVLVFEVAFAQPAWVVLTQQAAGLTTAGAPAHTWNTGVSRSHVQVTRDTFRSHVQVTREVTRSGHTRGAGVSWEGASVEHHVQMAWCCSRPGCGVLLQLPRAHPKLYYSRQYHDGRTQRA
eukprot:366556-Chlamydomonas_euryale.AAC.2